MKKAHCLKEIVKTVTGYDIPDTRPTISKCLTTLIEKCGSEKDLTGKTNCELLHELNEVIPNVIDPEVNEKYQALLYGTVELNFPAIVTTIPEKLCYAFQKMTKVTTTSVTSIGKKAFMGCGQLVNVTLNERIIDNW